MLSFIDHLLWTKHCVLCLPGTGSLNEKQRGLPTLSQNSQPESLPTSYFSYIIRQVLQESFLVKLWGGVREMISSLLESLYHQIMIYQALAHSMVSTEFISSLSLVNFYDFLWINPSYWASLFQHWGHLSLPWLPSSPSFLFSPTFTFNHSSCQLYFQMNNLFTGFHLHWVTNWPPLSVMYYSAMGKVMEPSSGITVKSTLESGVGRK